MTMASDSGGEQENKYVVDRKNARWRCIDRLIPSFLRVSKKLLICATFFHHSKLVAGKFGHFTVNANGRFTRGHDDTYITPLIRPCSP